MSFLISHFSFLILIHIPFRKRAHCRRHLPSLEIPTIIFRLTRNSTRRFFPLFFIITRNPSTFLPNIITRAFSGLVARTTVCWLREWVKASTFLVFLGLCFHSKAFLIVPFLFLVSFSFSGGGVRIPAGDVAAGGGWSFFSHCLGPFP